MKLPIPLPGRKPVVAHLLKTGNFKKSLAC
jgi:hypothetical protein